MCKLTESDREILKNLSQMETKLVARKLGISPQAIWQHLFKIRKHRREARIFLNQLLAYERQSLRLKKLLTPTR